MIRHILPQSRGNTLPFSKVPAPVDPAAWINDSAVHELDTHPMIAGIGGIYIYFSQLSQAHAYDDLWMTPGTRNTNNLLYLNYQSRHLSAQLGIN